MLGYVALCLTRATILPRNSSVSVRVALPGLPMLKFTMTVPVKKAGSIGRPPFSLEKNNRPAAAEDFLGEKIGFTGLGNVPTPRQRRRLGANALTSF